MMKEATAKAPTVEEAIQKALRELNAQREQCEIEILEEPRKSLFGLRTKGEACVRVTLPETEEYTPAPEPIPDPVAADAVEEFAGEGLPGGEQNDQKLASAKAYLSEILQAMGLDGVTIKVEEKKDGAILTFEGEGIAVLIGHHGETLDALQYLVALTCNRIDGEYYRITLDCGNYREKREATLKALASRIAAKVKKTGRSQLLEPMNPYERRIIHAVVSEIDGVTSKSKGEEPNRRVVILSENPRPYNKGGRDYSHGRKPMPPRKRERTMEEILKSDLDKSDFVRREESAELYSKIEL